MANAPAEAKYIVQESDVSLPNAQALEDLSSGLLKNNSGGVISIASPTADYLPYNQELASIAALSPAQGDILVAINSESWRKLSMGTVGRVLMATVGGPSYEPIIPYNTSIITATPSAGAVPSSRVLLGGDGISIIDAPGANALFISANGTLDSLSTLSTSGILINNSGTILTRSVASSGSITVTNPQGLAGNINLDVVNDTSYQKVRILSSSSLIGTRSNINFIPGSNVGLTIIDDGSNNRVDVTISATDPTVPAGVTWEFISSSQAMLPNKGYAVTGGSNVSLSLPTSISRGQMIRVVGAGTGNWTITQAASQQIILGTSSTTVGTGGSITSYDAHACIELLCTVDNTVFLCVSDRGNITVV